MNLMKRLPHLTAVLAAFLLCLEATAQESCPNLFDTNDNNTVDIEDFLAILGLFADNDLDDDGVWDSQDLCTDLEACNYEAIPSEPCGYIDALGLCGGGCEGDGDGDGICDSEDDCVGVYDECGVCNGPGPTEVVIDGITILYDSNENLDPWIRPMGTSHEEGSYSYALQFFNGTNMRVSATPSAPGGCYCSIKEIPKVEYDACFNANNTSAWFECCQEKVAQGWIPLATNPYTYSDGSSNGQAFWRWAE